MSNDRIPVPDYACEEHGEAFYTFRLLQSHNYQFHHLVDEDELGDELYGEIITARDSLNQVLAGKLTPAQIEGDVAEYLRTLLHSLEEGV